MDMADLLPARAGSSRCPFLKEKISRTRKRLKTSWTGPKNSRKRCRYFRKSSVPVIRVRHLLVLQADGIGTFKANTVMADIHCDDASIEEQLCLVPEYLGLKKNVLLVKAAQPGQRKQDRIDIWLSGFTSNLSIMLLLPYLVTRNPDWTGTKICLRMIVHEDERQRAERYQAISPMRESAEAEILALHDRRISHRPATIIKAGNHTECFARLMDFSGAGGSLLG